MFEDSTMRRTYKEGDKVILLGTKEGKTDELWNKYFESVGRHKGDVVTITSIYDGNSKIEYFVEKKLRRKIK